MTYSIHRLNNESDLRPYIEKMGWPDFKAYMEKVYNKIDSMKPGDKFKIDDLVKEENRDLFIKLLCYFICMHGTAVYYFHNNYTWFYRNAQEKK